MKIIGRCLKCGKKFTFTPVRGYIRQYCSIYCAHRRTNSGPKPTTDWRTTGRICPVCKSLFKKNRIYCSHKCAVNSGCCVHTVARDITYIKNRTKIDPITGCWEWQKAVTAGYGNTGKGLAHKIVYEIVHGKIKDARVVHHRCENKLCCNPAHLVLVTRRMHRILHIKLARQKQVRCRVQISHGLLWT